MRLRILIALVFLNQLLYASGSLENPGGITNGNIQILGSGGDLTNLGNFTICWAMYPLENTTAHSITKKGGAGTNRLQSNGTASRNIEYQRARATTNLDFVCGRFSTNEWEKWCVKINLDDVPTVTMFMGTGTAKMEAQSCSTSQNGAGALTNDSGGSYSFGGTASQANLGMDIGFISIASGSLTLNQMENQFLGIGTTGQLSMVFVTDASSPSLVDVQNRNHVVSFNSQTGVTNAPPLFNPGGN